MQSRLLKQWKDCGKFMDSNHLQIQNDHGLLKDVSVKVLE